MVPVAAIEPAPCTVCLGLFSRCKQRSNDERRWVVVDCQLAQLVYSASMCLWFPLPSCVYFPLSFTGFFFHISVLFFLVVYHAKRQNCSFRDSSSGAPHVRKNEHVPSKTGQYFGHSKCWARHIIANLDQTTGLPLSPKKQTSTKDHRWRRC